MARIRFTLKPGECRVVAGSRFCNRWERNTSQSTQDYERGIRSPKRSWAKSTCEAQDCYKAGVDAAQAKRLFAKGVKKAGTAKWREKALTKGPTRFAQGVSVAGGGYAAGFDKYHKIIKRTTLPARFPKGDSRNIGRCSAICAALGRAKAGKAVTGKVSCPDK